MHFRAVLACATLAFGLLQPASAAPWSQFRGPNAGGRVEETAPLPDELAPGKNMIWKTDLPAGHSSPALTSDRIFVTSADEDSLSTICIARKDGAILWKQAVKPNGPESIHDIGSHAQATPATDGERVVSFFGSFGLVCYDIDGKILWDCPLGPFKNTFGAGSSPIIVDDLVITNQDHDIDSFLMALDKRTGKTVWKTDRGEFPRGFTTPIVWNNAGQKQVVVTGSLRVAGYDLEHGQEQWTVRGFARIPNMTPVVGEDGNLYVAEWSPGADIGERIQAESYEVMKEKYDKDNNNTFEPSEFPPGPLQQRFKHIDRNKDDHITPDEYNWMREIFNTAENAVMAIKPGCVGDVTETHVLWKQNRFLPYVPSPVYHDGHLYMVKNGGIFTSLAVTDGEPVKQARLPKGDNYYSSPIVADGKMYLVNQKGELTVVTAEPKWKVISTSEFGEDVFATPAVADGRIYLRTSGHMYCFGLAH
jgi:outer membrane protein assembly factor BamB